MKEFSGVLAFINTGAGAGINDIWPLGINDDREHIGVVDNAALDVVPALTAVTGLPRQVPRTRVHNVGIRGIDGDGFNVLDLAAGVWRDPLPGLAPIARPVNAIKRPRNQDVRIGSCDRHWHASGDVLALVLVHVREFVEAGDLTGDVNGKVAGIKAAHAFHAAGAREDRATERVIPKSVWAQAAHSRDDHAPAHRYL